MITKHDLRQLIGRIKEVTGKTQREISEAAGYKPDSLSELTSQKNGNCEPAYRQLELIFAEVLKSSIPGQAGGERRQDNENQEGETPTIDILARALADQAEANKIQATANDKYASGFTALALVLERMEKGMAKETTLISLEANYLKRTLAAALTVAKGQEDGMKELRRLLSQEQTQKKIPSGGSGKGKDRIDGGLEKRGKTPA